MWISEVQNNVHILSYILCFVSFQYLLWEQRYKHGGITFQYWYYCYCNNTKNANIPDKTDLMAVLYQTRTLCGEVRYRTTYIFWATLCVLFHFNTYCGSRETNMEVLLSNIGIIAIVTIPPMPIYQTRLINSRTCDSWVMVLPSRMISSRLEHLQAAITRGSGCSWAEACTRQCAAADPRESTHHSERRLRAYQVERRCRAPLFSWNRISTHIFYVSLYSPTNAHNKI